MNLEDEILQLRSDALIAAPNGRLSFSDTKDAIRADVEALLISADRDVAREAESAMNDAIRPLRRSLRRRLRTELDYIADSLLSGEDGANIDPMMDVAFPLGDDKGDDKLLRYWTQDDLDGVVRTAYRKAAESTAAAADLDQTAVKIVDLMKAAGATIIGDLT